MANFQTSTVVEILVARRGLQRVRISSGEGDIANAYVLTDLIGEVKVGDSVIVNTTAVDLGLGTGGWHIIHWNLARSEWNNNSLDRGMKVRYTSLQTNVAMAEEDPAFIAPETLDGMPVVACLLHSQIACVAAAIRLISPTARIAFVMTDSASLPLVVSDLLDSLSSAKLIDVTVSTGQAFGGDFEAVNVASGLQVAKMLGRCDIAIVASGPGVIGTNTTFGYSAFDLVGVLDGVHRARGVAILALRVSDADARERHLGVSHQAKTILREAMSVVVGYPSGSSTVAELNKINMAHEFVEVDVPDVLNELERHDIAVASMGRSLRLDPRFAAFAAAAGVVAAKSMKWQ